MVYYLFTLFYQACVVTFILKQRRNNKKNETPGNFILTGTKISYSIGGR